MADLKRKLSLFVALVMLFGVLAPFAMPPVTVYANVAPARPNPNDAGTADDGDLFVTFNQRMSPANFRPDFHIGSFTAPDGGVMVNWPVSVDHMGPGFLDVLRFFDHHGNRHELTVMQLNAYDGVGLTVSYDIYLPVRAGGPNTPVTGYRHISDPIRPAGSVNGDFQIWVPVHGFVSANSFFNVHNGNHPVVDCEVNTRLNRVNDRLRFAPAAGGLFTPVLANYLDPTTNFNSHSTTEMIPNPDFDNTIPTDPVTNPEYIGVPYPSFSTAHYTWLSPSFNIAEGRGYSFRFGGSTIHFRWHEGQFYFFIEEFLQTGLIYEFVLEQYNSREDANEYIIGAPLQMPPVAGTPMPNRLVSPVLDPAPRPVPASSNTVYVFPGIDDRRYLNAIPFAHNLHVPDRPNTRAGNMGLHDTASPSALLINAPLFDTSPLNLTTDPPAIPAEPDLGLDIRFNLPSLHNEAQGNFSTNLMTHDLAGQLGIRMIARVGGATTTEDFDLQIPLIRNGDPIPRHVPNTNNPLDGWATLGIIDALNGSDTIAIRDISLLERGGVGFEDRLRIKIGGMRPSIAYENVSLSLTTDPPPGTPGQITPAPSNFLSNPQRIVADHDRPFYTFLRMRFDRLLWDEVVVVEPFNYSVGRTRYPSWYHLEIHGDDAPTSKPFTRGESEIYFTLPRGFVIPFIFTVSRSHSQDPVISVRQFSQDVWWQPTPFPNIDLPHSFRITDVLHRPMRGDALAGHLNFTVQWSIATYTDIRHLLGSPDGRFGYPDDILHVSYVIGHSVSPETQALMPGADNVHREYLHINMLIRQNPDTGALEVMYLESSDFIYPERFLGNATYPPTPHPIVNRGEWLPLERRMDGAFGQYAVIADIQLQTNTARRFRYPPPPAHLRDDFQFPGIYFLNVRLDSWSVERGDTMIERGGSTPWSLFDDMVIDDFGTLSPPPPANLTVSAGPGENEPPTQPFLDVSYDIPTGAILAYLQTLYPMETQITTNLYIGQFHEALMDAYFPYPELPVGDPRRMRQPLDPELRDSRAAISVRFDDPRLNATFTAPRTHLDLSADVFQNILRGADEGAYPSGVIRITDIPLTHIVPVTTTPAGLSFGAGDIVNYSMGDLSQEESFAETYRILNQPAAFPVSLRLTGLEENTAFFLIADLEIEKWVEDEETEEMLRREIDDPAVSDLTGVVTDTTVGTPQPPGPGEVGPSAPQNLRIYELDQMMAAVRWDPYILTPDEIESGVLIEWEIIRVQDGERMTDAQMNMRNLNFLRVFNEQLVTAPGHRKGWTTDVDAITVFPANTVIPEPNDYYVYDRRIVELRDFTLLPNNLYFYYVRTVRIESAWDDQLNSYVMIRTVSSWVEVSATTHPIQPPVNLRQEDPGEGDDFCGMTMVAVSWEHVLMPQILEGMGDLFVFRYQIRESGRPWGEILTVPPERMTEAALNAYNPLRIHYIADGLEHGTIYEMRVQLYDLVAQDASLWSNVIVFMTEMDQEDERLDREIDDWLDYLRRRVEEFLRREFWIAHRTPHSTTVVIRPEDVFLGLMQGTVGTDIRLHNPGTDRVVYYIPASAVFTANENRYGFGTAWDDIEFLFSPSFLNDAHNQAMIDMARAIDARGSDISDSFVRLEFIRTELDEINNRPAITPSTQLSVSMVGTNDSIRNIATWDRNMLRRATRIVEDWLTDSVMRENIRVQLMDELSNEEMSDHLYAFLDRILQEIINATSEYIAYGGDDGILSDRIYEITEFNAVMHVIALPPRDTYSVFGYEFLNAAWRQQDLAEYHNGRAMRFRRPGTFAFTGREIIIPDIEITPRGDTVISIVARYGLEDLFGVYVDLEQFANRQMVIGSIARAAGVPANANAMNWAAANLDVQLTSRNATGLISRQEAIAVTAALYAHRTNTPLNTLRITNHQNTAGMNLDPRFAQGVRAAFELGLVSDTEMDIAGPITIGEFLDMLTLLNARVRV